MDEHQADARDLRILALWQDGKSQPQIIKIMAGEGWSGITRNTIAGVVHRDSAAFPDEPLRRAQ